LIEDTSQGDFVADVAAELPSSPCLDEFGRSEDEVKEIRKQLMDLYDRMLQRYEHRKIGKSGANAGAAIKKFLADGLRLVEVPYVEKCYHDLKDGFWKGKHLNLHVLHEQYWAWRAEYKKQHEARKAQRKQELPQPEQPVMPDPDLVALYGADYYQ
jgi:hypothetical protein